LSTSIISGPNLGRTDRLAMAITLDANRPASVGAARRQDTNQAHRLRAENIAQLRSDDGFLYGRIWFASAIRPPPAPAGASGSMTLIQNSRGRRAHFGRRCQPSTPEKFGRRGRTLAWVISYDYTVLGRHPRAI